MDMEQIQAYIAAIQPAGDEQERGRQYYAELDNIGAQASLQDKTARLLADRLGL